MNLEKSSKRISKKVKRGFQGYPQITISYYGPNDTLATKVCVGYVEEKGADTQFEKFVTQNDVRNDIAVQSTIVKIIDRSSAKTVSLIDKILGCPHEEGTDYPAGDECPLCHFWQGKVRSPI